MEELWKPGPREKREKGKNGKTEGWKNEKKEEFWTFISAGKSVSLSVCQTVSLLVCLTFRSSNFPSRVGFRISFVLLFFRFS